MLPHSDRHIGKLAQAYVNLNSFGEAREIDPDDQDIIDLLKKYDASLRA